MKGKGLPKLSKRVIGVIEPVFQKCGNESSTEKNCRAFSTSKRQLNMGGRGIDFDVIARNVFVLPNTRFFKSPR